VKPRRQASSRVAEAAAAGGYCGGVREGPVASGVRRLGLSRAAPGTARRRKDHGALAGWLFVSVTLVAGTTALGATIYDNTVLSGAASGLTGSDRTIQVDDVLVPTSRDPSHLPIAIDSITLGLQAMPGDSGVFSIYLYSVQSDGAPAPHPMLIDTLAVTFPTFYQRVTFQSDSGPLLTVDPDFTTQPGFGLFYIGLEAGAILAANWAWADGPDTNLPTAYLDNITASHIFLNTSPGPFFPPSFSFYMEIEGAPIPEPSQIAFDLVIVLAGGVWAMTGGRRLARQNDRAGDHPRRAAFARDRNVPASEV
jgi:hypothetical protein